MTARNARQGAAATADNARRDPAVTARNARRDPAVTAENARRRAAGNEQLAAALAGEEAAIYAYGLIGVRLTADGEVTQARSAEEAHRARRDYLVSKIDQVKASAAPAPAGYQLPFAVTDRASALKLAIHVEDGVAQAWRPVLGATSGADRGTALSAMTDAAVRATRWRRLAAVSPLTLPFPGRPT